MICMHLWVKCITGARNVLRTRTIFFCHFCTVKVNNKFFIYLLFLALVKSVFVIVKKFHAQEVLFFLLLVVICVFLIIIFSFSWPQILHVIHSSCSPIISHRNIAKCWCGSNRIGHFFINKRSAMTSRTHISYSHNVYFTPFCTQIDRYIDR